LIIRNQNNKKNFAKVIKSQEDKNFKKSLERNIKVVNIL